MLSQTAANHLQQFSVLTYFATIVICFFFKIFLHKKPKLNNNLLLFQEVDEKQAIINRVVYKNPTRRTLDVFSYRKTECVFSILIEKHLRRAEFKFREFFRLSGDRFSYVLNIIENDITTSPSIKFPKPITAAEKLVVT